ncbi:hydrogenase-4 component F [Geothermobacter ehrlichii]|uniref:Hydrogenase-4 component F n=1 Tax=Geothermobacter ehrlichii TaxID=213224 RepID=A0A5D3WM98_9BACT|nr:hydrogenase 4 subunit F [Geothermobacter ehrlichii]TYP00113.1 hydrogenase-4 component F [Geothermobacter ehrlichii]
MIALYLTLLIPLTATLVFAVIGHWKFAGTLNLLVCIATFVTSLLCAINVFDHGPLMSPGKLFYVDAFNVYLILVNALVGLTTAIFSRPYMAHEVEIGRVDDARMRLYHSMYQGFLLTMLVALTTNNLGLLWVAVEGATLATVLLVSLYRTPESIEAGWKYFILCGVGIAQALFGTVLVYFAAERVLPGVEEALLWSVLKEHAAQLEPTVLTLAFVFLLVGYGTKIGLVPLHNWLPDAHSEGPTPMSAILSGLLLNVALYAVVRYKMLIEPALGNHLPGYLMMGFGMLSFTVAGILLHRQRDIKRMFSYSSIEHMGLMTLAFGIGGPLATFGGLLHMIVHSLTKSAIFVTVGHAAHVAGTQSIDRIRGLIRTQPAIGWSLLLGTVAIAGFPPFGVFTSEFLLFSATMKSWPWLVIPLLLGLAVAFAGLFRHLQPMVFGEPPQGQRPVRANLLPVLLHLLLVLWLGISIPDVLSRWLDQATIMVVGKGVL